MSLCLLFIDNKLSTQFGEGKFEYILFSKAHCLKDINISFASHSIKQYDTTEYLGCQLGTKLSGEAVASKVLKKINVKLKFRHRKSRYLTSAVTRLLCNVLIQPHFDCGCSSLRPVSKKNILKIKRGISCRSIAL